jgi:hypothetical protein
MQTNRRTLGQIAFCVGCCCGRPDRGYPAVPVQQLKSAWKAEKLNGAVQLTISGCLGPCDLPNVALVLTPTGQTWIGKIAGDDDFDSLLDWARACKASGSVQPLPARFADRTFDRFPQTS